MNISYLIFHYDNINKWWLKKEDKYAENILNAERKTTYFSSEKILTIKDDIAKVLKYCKINGDGY